MDWIKIEDGLPPEKEEVLVYTREKIPYLAEYRVLNDKVHWEETTEYQEIERSDRITHWAEIIPPK